MVENRSSCFGNPSSQNRETVCIDTYRVLDSCRDRDCYEDARVYLTAVGQEAVNSTTSVRAKNAEILWSYVGVEPIMFNRGFYRVTVKTYLLLSCEACLGIGSAQEFSGLCILEKNVILYGGDGNVTTYKSVPGAGYCDFSSNGSMTNSLPIGVSESAPPLILSLRVAPAPCPYSCGDTSPAPNAVLTDIPDSIMQYFDSPIMSGGNCYLYATVGIFSVTRIERPAQLLVNAGDYSVPDKECLSPSTDDPCGAFRRMPFPVDAFTYDNDTALGRVSENGGNGGCGCRGKADTPTGKRN